MPARTLTWGYDGILGRARGMARRAEAAEEGDGPVGGADAVEEFAESLRALKERSGRSYAALATHLHVSTSTLHRYCKGDAVPADYAPVERLARLCGATPDEQMALHRRWLLADASRATTRAPAAGPRGRGPAPGTPAAADEPGPSGAALGTPNGPAEAVPASGGEGAEGPGAGRFGGDSAGRAHPHPGGAARRSPGGRPTERRAPDAERGDDAGAAAPSPARPRPGDVTRRTAGRRAPGAKPAADAGQFGAAPDADGGSRPGPTGARHTTAGRARAAARARRAAGAARAGGRAEARGGSARGRLRAVPGDTAAVRAPWRARPWALVAGAAAVVVLAVTAVEVRSSPGTTQPRRHTAASPPAASATPKAPATRPPTAGPTARGHLDREVSGDGPKPGAPHGEEPGRREGGTAAAPGASRPPGSGSARLPLTLSTRSHVWENGCDHRYLIDRPPADVAPPPTEQDAPAWAAAHDAVHGGTTNVEVTVQGRAAESAVVLRALHVRVVGRRTPLAWSSFAMENGCGGSLTPRAFSVDLDAARPQARPTDGNDAGKPIPAVRFPYRVSASDPEVLLVNARTAGCDCSWYLELEWTSGDRSGTARIDDDGAPFRTSGAKGRPAYIYDYAEGAWRRDA
ncbi:helix-turn-helix domain-containing protein [Streptomyces sp. NPDC019937]|uniref:transcriptional regulator n=1 Tax=Streptomyces sp. NPDC019937 TaxID=3154787 RepID=UPI0033DC1CB0